MDVIITDGGRALAGFRGETGDCFVRALSIAVEMDYREAYNLTRLTAKKHGERSPRHGVKRKISDEILRAHGWHWVATMGVGTGCKVHLCKDDLPPGRLICRVSRHWVAVLDGVAHDNHDPTRGKSRCVYGFWWNPKAVEYMDTIEECEAEMAHQASLLDF